MTVNLTSRIIGHKAVCTANNGFKKLSVQWFNEGQFFNSTFMRVDSLVPLNRQLLTASQTAAPVSLTHPREHRTVMFTLLKRGYLCPFMKGCPKDGVVAVSYSLLTEGWQRS